MILPRKLNKPKRHLYAIGDIHGCNNELVQLLDKLELDSELDQVVFIGDYVDRGLESKAVVETLIEFKKKYPSTVFLRGNHEDMMLSYLGFGGQNGRYFLQNGGNLTLKSYGIDFNYNTPPSARFFAALQELNHFEFFTETEIWVECNNFIFVHAGINPHIESLKDQKQESLFWIREEFLEVTHLRDETIVFGHTPLEEVQFGTKKIGIDTGCAFGGKLSCIELNTNKIIDVKSNYDYRKGL